MALISWLVSLFLCRHDHMLRERDAHGKLFLSCPTCLYRVEALKASRADRAKTVRLLRRIKRQPTGSVVNINERKGA